MQIMHMSAYAGMQKAVYAGLNKSAYADISQHMHAYCHKSAYADFIRRLKYVKHMIFVTLRTHKTLYT